MDPACQILEEWRKLTEKEGASIRRGDWTLVQECQEAKNQLQPLILSFESHFYPRLNEGEKAAIKVSLDRILELETENRELLTQGKEAIQAEQRQLELNSLNLRKVHRSYSFPTPASWRSYS